MNWLTVNFPNWPSFVIGLALSIAYATHAYLLEGTVHKSSIAVALLLAALGFVVKYKAVTGGSIAQTPEAVQREQPVNAKAVKNMIAPLSTLIALFFIAFCFLSFAGCMRKTGSIANVPTGVSEAEVKDWYAATGAIAIVGNSTEAATNLAISINRADPTNPDYQKMLSVFGHIAQGGISAGNVLSASPEHFTASTRDQIIAFAGDALGQLGPYLAGPQPKTTTARTIETDADRMKLQAQLESLQSALKRLQSFTARPLPENQSYWQDPENAQARLYLISSGPILYPIYAIR